MTFLQFLATLKADPREDPGRSLIFAEGKLSDAQRSQVIGSTYGRRPYVVVVHEQLGSPIRMHSGKGLFVAAVDAFLFHPSTVGQEPDGDALASLQASLLDSRDEVNEVRNGYYMASSFLAITELPPHFVRNENFDGLMAVTRFTYRLWR